MQFVALDETNQSLEGLMPLVVLLIYRCVALISSYSETYTKNLQLVFRANIEPPDSFHDPLQISVFYCVVFYRYVILTERLL